MRTGGSSLRHDPVSSADARRIFRTDPFWTLLATGFGAGLSPVVPGSVGSLVGLAAAWLVRARLSSGHDASLPAVLGLLMSALVVAAIGVPAASRVARQLGVKDPGCVVIDEVAGQLLACAAIPLFGSPSAWAQAFLWITSFLAFRLFDIWKPGPVRRLQDLPEGWGIVADDLLAGLLAAAMTLAAGWVFLSPRP